MQPRATEPVLSGSHAVGGALVDGDEVVPAGDHVLFVGGLSPGERGIGLGFPLDGAEVFFHSQADGVA